MHFVKFLVRSIVAKANKIKLYYSRTKAIYNMVLCLKMRSNVELSRPRRQLLTLGDGILVKLKCMKLF